jgi:hypothetical protein
MDATTSIKALALEGFESGPKLIEVPSPEAGPGEVLVRVTAASVNAYDTFVAMGMARSYMSYKFPAVLGQDIAGVVEAVGAGAEGFEGGDRVFGTMGAKGVVHDGSFGELSTPQASALSVIPDGVDDQQAGSLGVAGTTAMSASAPRRRPSGVRGGRGGRIDPDRERCRLVRWRRSFPARGARNAGGRGNGAGRDPADLPARRRRAGACGLHRRAHPGQARSHDARWMTPSFVEHPSVTGPGVSLGAHHRRTFGSRANDPVGVSLGGLRLRHSLCSVSVVRDG